MALYKNKFFFLLGASETVMPGMEIKHGQHSENTARGFFLYQIHKITDTDTKPRKFRKYLYLMVGATMAQMMRIRMIPIQWLIG